MRCLGSSSAVGNFRRWDACFRRRDVGSRRCKSTHLAAKLNGFSNRSHRVSPTHRTQRKTCQSCIVAVRGAQILQSSPRQATCSSTAKPPSQIEKRRHNPLPFEFRLWTAKGAFSSLRMKLLPFRVYRYDITHVHIRATHEPHEPHEPHRQYSISSSREMDSRRANPDFRWARG